MKTFVTLKMTRVTAEGGFARWGEETRKRMRQARFIVASAIEKDALKSSISLLKRNKYGLPNAEMYAIVKAEISKEMALIIQDLQARLSTLN
jgi:hypothetical protein